MSSFLNIPYSRLKNKFSSLSTHSPPTEQHYETTEMTQIVNLDSFMALMDARKILDSDIEEDSDDDNSSLSSDNSAIRYNKNKRNMSDKNKNGVQYNYNEDEEEEEYHSDEAEQSLVGNRDIEQGENSSSSIKKVPNQAKFLFIFLYTEICK
jgi:hypothetical protein